MTHDVQPDLLQLDDESFVFRWSAMTDEERSAVPGGHKRYRKIMGGGRSTLEVRALESIERRITFPYVWVCDISITLVSTDYIKGIIGQAANVLVYGPSGFGKTFFVIDMAWHLAVGESWRGRRTKPCMCVYVAAEAGTSIARRFVAIRRGGRTDVPLAIITRGPNLLHRAEVDALIQQLRAMSEDVDMPIGVVVFDTLSRSTAGGDENSAEDMTRVIAAADRIRDELGTTTIFVHHSGKDFTKGARGHSSLYAAADTVISVQDKIATIEKARDGSTGDAFPFDLEVVELGRDEDDEAVTTCIVRHLENAKKSGAAKNLTNAERIALDALRAAIADNGSLLPGTTTIPAGTRGMKLATWRDAFKRSYGEDEDRSDDATKKAFRRAKEGLLADKVVGISDPWVWIY